MGRLSGLGRGGDSRATIARLEERLASRRRSELVMFGMASPLSPVRKRPRRRRQHEGVEVRHARRCLAGAGQACSCTPGYQAQVWSARDQKPIRKTFATFGAAKAWRQESQVALRRGTLRAPSPTTLAEAAEDWLEAA